MPRRPMPYAAIALAPYQDAAMCRNIRTLFNFEPPATEIEIRDAALQFVRKLSGFSVPSRPLPRRHGA